MNAIPPWFRVPVQLIQSEPEEARGWLYLLGQWHIGASPGHNEVRRALGWGAGRVQKFSPKVAKWALAHGATVPEEVAEHFRSSSGAIAEQQRSDTGAPVRALTEENQAAPEQYRSSSGAVAEQQRSDSRAGDPFRKKERSEEREERGEPPTRQPQQEGPPEAPGASGGASGRPASPESNLGQARPVSGTSLPVPAEGDLLPLLTSQLQMGQAAAVGRLLHTAGIYTVADAAPMDEWEIGRIVGTNHKVGTIKALRAGGWLPPKERSTRPALPTDTAGPSGVKKRTLFAQIGKEDADVQPQRNQRAS